MKIGHTMPELQPFTFHEKFVAHPVYNIIYFIANIIKEVTVGDVS